MNQDDRDMIADMIGAQLGQLALVSRCIVHSIARQPSFDADAFRRALKEESGLLPDGSFAREIIDSIISDFGH